jgi:hypothetical protein
MTQPSRRQEEGLAKTHGGRRVAGSGNGHWTKNDVRNSRVSYEAKTTKHKSFTLKLEELLKAERNALMDGRESVFVVEFDNEKTHRPFYVVPASLYLEQERAWLSSQD